MVKIQDEAERLVLKGCVSKEWQALKSYSVCQVLYYIFFSPAILRAFTLSLCMLLPATCHDPLKVKMARTED